MLLLYELTEEYPHLKGFPIPSYSGIVPLILTGMDSIGSQVKDSGKSEQHEKAASVHDIFAFDHGCDSTHTHARSRARWPAHIFFRMCCVTDRLCCVTPKNTCFLSPNLQQHSFPPGLPTLFCQTCTKFNKDLPSYSLTWFFCNLSDV